MDPPDIPPATSFPGLFGYPQPFQGRNREVGRASREPSPSASSIRSQVPVRSSQTSSKVESETGNVSTVVPDQHSNISPLEDADFLQPPMISLPYNRRSHTNLRLGSMTPKYSESLSDRASSSARSSSKTKEPETRYVLAGQPTGWAAMAEDIRSYDEEIIRDCKEDIDTLMTFAGLFSAALTAFLVESYQSLLPLANSDQQLSVLRFMAVQNTLYRAGDPLWNATVLDTSSGMAQQASQTTVVWINCLWFASLVTSLVSASFGMLVKQWLREYLAVNNPSPQARLRVRRARNPTLDSWKVFEIAAALPLLLQLSLALFFAGLCLFTSSVHNAVGLTSLTLVLSWAFCFIAATLLPAFFPRCPYKTAFLKNLLRMVYRMLSAVLGVRDRGADESKIARDPSGDLDILADVDRLQADDELLATTIIDSIGQIHPPPSLQQSANFLKHILTHRVTLNRSNDQSWPIDPELSVLTTRGKEAILDIIGRYVQPPAAQSTESISGETSSEKGVLVDDTPVFHQICTFLLSPSLQPLPSNCAQVLKAGLTTASQEIFTALVIQSCDYDRTVGAATELFSMLLDILKSSCENFDFDLGWTWNAFQSLLQAYISSTAIDPRSFEGRIPEPWDVALVLQSQEVYHAGSFLCGRLTRELQRIRTLKIGSFNSSSASVHDTLTFVLGLYNQPERDARCSLVGNLSELLSEMYLADSPAASSVLSVFMTQTDRNFYADRLPSIVAHLRHKQHGTSNLHRYVANFHTVVQHYMNVGRAHRLHCIRLFYLAVLTYACEDAQDVALNSAWRSLFMTFNDLLLQSKADIELQPSVRDVDWLVPECFYLIQRKDVGHEELRNNLGYPRWREAFDVRQTVFSDGLIATLRSFCRGDATQFCRVRRLDEVASSRNGSRSSSGETRGTTDSSSGQPPRPSPATDQGSSGTLFMLPDYTQFLNPSHPPVVRRD